MVIRKRVGISVIVLVVIAAIGFGILRMYESRPGNKPQVTQYDGDGVDFAVPKDWTVELYGDRQFRIAYSSKKEGDAVIFLDASGAEPYSNGLARQRGSFIDPQVTSAFFGGLQGQQIEGTVQSTDDQSGYGVATVLDNNGYAVTIVLQVSANANRELLIEDYRILLSSLDLGVDKQEAEIVKRDEAGREIVPTFVRDGINATHAFENGTHTITGFIEFPTPCYDLTSNVEVIPGAEQDFVIVKLLAVEPSGQLCAQVLTEKDFSISFEASENARIQGQYNTLPVNFLFNL